MATITPQLVTSFEELNKNILNGASAIIVTNKNLFPAIKKRIKTMKSNNRLKTTSKVTGFGMLAVTALSAEISIPFGLALAGVSFIIGRKSKIIKQSSQYKILDLSQEKNKSEDFLILLKVKGANSFNENNDVLDLENFKTSLSQNSIGVSNENSI